MKILGAGFCRTGTLSTRRALIDLGLDPCFHMANVHDEGLDDLFVQFFNGNHEPLVDYLKENGFMACVDFPMSVLVDQMMVHFPEAKVLLNVRDSAKTWVNSYRESVYLATSMPVYVRINLLVGGWIANRSSYMKPYLHELIFQRVIDCGNQHTEYPLPQFNWSFTDNQFRAMYQNWVEFIINTVPAERLLVFNVKDGMLPLANFCNISTACKLLPQCNNSQSFKFYLHVIKIVAIALYCLVALLVAGLCLGSNTCVYSSVVGYLLLRVTVLFIPKFGMVKGKTE